MLMPGEAMTLDGHEFGFVCWIMPETEADGSIRRVRPQGRYRNSNGRGLHPYGDGEFCRFTVPRGYTDQGVYVLTVSDRVVYIGECEGLSIRFNAGYGNISPRNCFEGGQQTNCRLNKLIKETVLSGGRVGLLFHKTTLRKTIESELIAAFGPEWNRTGARPYTGSE